MWTFLETFLDTADTIRWFGKLELLLECKGIKKTDQKSPSIPTALPPPGRNNVITQVKWDRSLDGERLDLRVGKNAWQHLTWLDNSMETMKPTITLENCIIIILIIYAFLTRLRIIMERYQEWWCLLSWLLLYPNNMPVLKTMIPNKGILDLRRKRYCARIEIQTTQSRKSQSQRTRKLRMPKRR